MYEILNRDPIKWSSLILDTILKAKRYLQYPLPYSLLISRICEYKGVDTTGELCQSTVRANEIAESSLKQLKLVPPSNTYVHRNDMPNYEAEDEELPPTDPISPAAQNVGSSSGVGSSFSIEDNIANMNKRLEELFLLSNSCVVKRLSHLGGALAFSQMIKKRENKFKRTHYFILTILFVSL